MATDNKRRKDESIPFVNGGGAFTDAGVKLEPSGSDLLPSHDQIRENALRLLNFVNDDEDSLRQWSSQHSVVEEGSLVSSRSGGRNIDGMHYRGSQTSIGFSHANGEHEGAGNCLGETDGTIDKLFRSEGPRHRKRACLIVVAVAAVVLISVSLGVALGRNSVLTGSLGDSSTLSTTTAPTPALPGYGEDYLRVRSQLISLSPWDEGAAMDDESTPQHAALLWVSQDPNLAKYDEHRVARRYALATFFHATGGSSWDGGNSLSSPESSIATYTEDKEGAGWTVSMGKEGGWTGWMGWDNECGWYGVVCTSKSNRDSASDEIEDELNGIGFGVIEEEMAESSEALEELNLFSSNLTGTLPLELALLTDLSKLALYDNDIQGEIPTTLGLLTKLTKLHLDGNMLHGSIPSEVFSIPLLKELRLEDNELKGSISTAIGNLGESIIEIRLEENLLTSTIPTEIGHLKNLVGLRLDANEFTGSLPDEMLSLPDLRGLRVDDNYLSGMINLRSARMPRIEVLRLDYNDFEGTLPSELGLLGGIGTGLRHLGLNTNRFSGTIPSELANLGSLEQLRLDRNQLVGSIPRQVGLLTKLVQLRLDGEAIQGDEDSEGGGVNNQLTGPLPSELGNLKKLEVLYAQGNALTGSLPSELGHLNNAVAIYLYNNQFSGEIPTTFGQMLSLEELYLDGNELVGTVPQELCSLRSEPTDKTSNSVTSSSGGKLDKLTTDCRGAPPVILCSCCSRCYPEDGATFPPAMYQTMAPVAAPVVASSPTELSALSSAPTPVPSHTTPVPTSSEFSKLASLLSAASPDGGLALAERSTVQNKAANWLLGSNLYFTYTDHRKVQRYALATLYLGLDGPNWWSSNGWLDDGENECDWSDVTCNEAGHVIKLDLYDNSLNGSLPEEVVLLKDSLQELILYSNSIESDDWSFLGQLKELTILDLDHNELGGTIPSQLASLTKIEKLYLGRNNIGGSIPSDVFVHLPKLTLLRLEDNALMGSFPLDIGNWGSGNLEQLRISDNSLTGSIPQEIGQQTKLSKLQLYGNDLMGQIPTEIGLLTKLEVLQLQLNRLTTSIPTEFGQLSQIIALDLSEMESDGEVENTKAFEANIIEGSLPTELGNLANLVKLRLRGNRIEGSIPSEISGMVTLQELRLTDNKIIGSIPTQVGNLAKLEVLRIDENLLTGTIPTEIGLLSHLQVLRLDGPNLPDGPEGNKGNTLTGKIPTEIGNLRYMIELRATENELSGSLPSQLAKLGFIVDMRFGINRLTGTIPEVMAANLTDLVDLDLYHNFFSGTIPASLANMDTLEDLYLDENFFSGEIPSELGNILPLNELYLNGNDFQGTMPEEICALRGSNLSALVSDCAGSVPQVVCPTPVCCTECHA